MEFEFNDEQKMIKKTIREFGEKEIIPVVREMDKTCRIPDKIIKGMAELGILGMTFSKEYGGSEADPVTVGVVAEELARADIGCAIPTFFLVQCAWGYILDKYGTETIKREILPRVCAGNAFIGIAATEANAGSDLANIRTSGESKNGKYLISGEKHFISGINEINNQLSEGGGYVTVVKTAPEKGVKGMSLFYIPVKNVEGITVNLLEEWGRKGVSSGGFAMEQVELSRDNLIGEEGRGFYLAMEGFDYARAIISLVACGCALSCLEQAMSYIKTRQAFGQPLARFEGIQFRLAEHWTRLEAARLLGYKALWMYGKEQKEKMFSRFEVSKICAGAKLNAVPTAFDAINDAIQWFGAYGYTTDCPLELGLKGVRSYYWAEGALEIMKVIVGRELLGKEFIAYR